MQFSKAALLIFSVLDVASAGTRGRRLSQELHPDCAAACEDKGHKDLIAAYTANLEAIESGDLSSFCDHVEALKCIEAKPACQDKDGRRLSNETSASSPASNETSGSSPASNETSAPASSEASSSGSSEASSSGSSEAASSESGEEGHGHDHSGDNHDHEDSEEEQKVATSETVACTCACPTVEKEMEDMSEENMCKKTKRDAMKCLFTNSACKVFAKAHVTKGQPKEDVEKSMELECKYQDKKCKKRRGDFSTCTKGVMDNYQKEGCDQAAKDATLESKKDACCPAFEKMVSCYSLDCMNVDMERKELDMKMKGKHATQEDKDDMKKEKNKQKEIGMVCPNTGLAPPEDNVATTSDAWTSLPRAISLVFVVGSLVA